MVRDNTEPVAGWASNRLRDFWLPPPKLPTGAIIGIAFGAVIFSAIVAAVIWYMCYVPWRARRAQGITERIARAREDEIRRDFLLRHELPDSPPKTPTLSQLPSSPPPPPPADLESMRQLVIPGNGGTGGGYVIKRGTVDECHLAVSPIGSEVVGPPPPILPR